MPTLAENLEVTRFVVRSLDVRRRELSWEITDTYADPRDFTLQVLRSESPSGPFDPVSPEFEDRYLFVDADIPVGDHSRILWYKLRIKAKATNTVTETAVAAVEPEADLAAQYIRRVQMTGLTQVFGRQVWLFKKRTFGMRCPSCFDRDTGQRTRSMCLSCFDTGFLRGYMDPIEVWMQIDPTPKNHEVRDMQTVQVNVATSRMGFYPNVSPGDVVVEAENKRWRVMPGVQQSERLRAVVHQELTLRQIQEGDIEYKLPINLDRALRDIQPSPGRMFTMPLDVNAAVDERIPNIFAYYPETYPTRLEE